MYMRTNIYIDLCVYMYVCTNICVYISTCVCIHVLYILIAPKLSNYRSKLSVYPLLMNEESAIIQLLILILS